MSWKTICDQSWKLSKIAPNFGRFMPPQFLGGPRPQSWNRVTGHWVSDYVRVGSGLGSKLFSYRPGISTRYLPEQRNVTASVYMLGTHERIVQSRGSMRPLTQSNKRELIASQLAPCPAVVSSRGRRCTTTPSSKYINNPSRLPRRLIYSNPPPCRLLRPQVVQHET